ncbi:MAG: type II toxin-antitoxin system VapB family antitoxin [Chthoniobacterales bacterium]|nr:type II toxin-antitoxin system VapB family antitoxin [Chthoniobacterales bacterium]
MRATINIDSELFAKAKAFALSEKLALQSLVIEGVHHVLGTKLAAKKSSRLKLITSSASGGACKGVNINSNSALRDLMDFS